MQLPTSNSFVDYQLPCPPLSHGYDSTREKPHGEKKGFEPRSDAFDADVLPDQATEAVHGLTLEFPLEVLELHNPITLTLEVNIVQLCF